MKTGSHLKIQNLGSNVLGVRLEGSQRKPEPDEFRVSFPGGDVSIVRCTDGSYWAHLRVDHPQAGMFNPDTDTAHRIVDARLDIAGCNTSEVDTGEFDSPDLYHVAFRVRKAKAQ